MLLIHGMWGTPNQWNKFIEYFKERNIKARAIEYKKGERASFMDYAREVAKFAKGEILVGHSMGGLIVQKVAEMVEIKAGIAIGSAPPKGIKFRNAGLMLHSMKYVPNILLKKPFKPSYGFIRKFLLNCVDEKRAIDIYKNMPPESPVAAYELFMNKISVDEKRVKSPLLFLAGKNDRVAPIEMEEKIARKYGAKLETYNGCHWIFDEPHEIGKKIIDFMAYI